MRRIFFLENRLDRSSIWRAGGEESIDGARVDSEEVGRSRAWGGGGIRWWSSGSRKIYITRNTGVTYKPRTGSGHSAPAQSRIQIGGTLNWVNVRIYRVTGISRKSYSPHLGSQRRDSRLLQRPICTRYSYRFVLRLVHISRTN